MKQLSRFVVVVVVLGMALLAIGPASASDAGTLTKEFYGTTAGGEDVYEYTLTNANGMEVKIITYGGTITSIMAPDHQGDMANVTLGFDNLQDYETKSPYFGCITGRYANRIANGKFELDGKTYCLDRNNGQNSLHGGIKGFDKMVWEVTKEITNEKGAVGIELHYLSKAGEGWDPTLNNNQGCIDAGGLRGYPGDLDVYVTYRLTDKNEIRMDYKATTTAPTVLNLTNHTYWNLMGEGEGDINDHILSINADKFTPVDATLIPTGIEPVAGTPFDFRQPKPISDGLRSDHPQVIFGRGWDHNWVLNRQSGDKSLMLAATLREPANDVDKDDDISQQQSEGIGPIDDLEASAAGHGWPGGIILQVWTTEPGIQFYSGNFLDGSVYGTSHRAYRQGDGLALETQHYPDSPNHPNDPAWPSTVLRPGETYESTTIFKLGAHYGWGRK